MTAKVLKKKLQDGECVYGTWVRIPAPVTVEVLGSAGLDFLHIDLEHSSIDLPMLDSMVLAGYSQGIPLAVRTASQNPADMYRIQDIGITSLMLPRIETAEQCSHLLSGIRYAPAGVRGLGGAVRANRWGAISLEEHLKEAEEETIVIVQIESQKGLDNMEEILDVPGIDVLYIGPFDLSQALGYTGQVTHPKVQETILAMIQSIRKRGIAVGIHVSTEEEAKYWAEQGVQYFTISMDIAFLRSGAASLVASLK
ncbi:HpcH/HpaI aldolase family protein [Ammoniphilus resinae]|uniref:4-hydroxy-2-oxoheptanedioate aldolase n=1 Tax=Ammoniphilus resinae TaxID=861532 RepID=A0ABS4GNG3_9BACL|nr:aldolase/citrate lyase family protein [Ammoniphilus resinae]MBP1931597.1 4-hydroxy-2-oxoheptanedioate aldolase [Ammoniphilus resinae]